MLGLTSGELFLVTFITVAVVTARYWPLLGQKIALWVTGHAEADPNRPGPPAPGPPAP